MFLYFLQQRQLSPEPGSGGYSMADLENDDLDETLNEDGSPKGKTEGKTADELAAEQKEAADKVAKDAELLEQQEAAKREEADKAKPENTDKTPESDDDDEDSFWDEVDALRGETIEVDYGDVDPLSPEGALLREQTIEARAVDQFEANLEKMYPRAYAYLLHTSAGGKDEDFFQTVGNTELPTAEQLETDIELQKQIITQSMKAKGNNERMIAAVIKDLVASDDLEEVAKEALESEQKAVQGKLDAIKATAAAETEKKNNSVKEMTNYVGQVVATGKIDNITIPEADRKPFADNFNKNVRYENGKFYHVTELKDENIADVFKRQFYEFKGGKIDDLIEQKARTLNAKRIGKTLHTDKKTKSSGGGVDANFVSLGDI